MRRVESIVDGSETAGRGGRDGALGGGGWRRDSQVSRSVRRLVTSIFLVFQLGERGGKSVPCYLLL